MHPKQKQRGDGDADAERDPAAVEKQMIKHNVDDDRAEDPLNGVGSISRGIRREAAL